MSSKQRWAIITCGVMVISLFVLGYGLVNATSHSSGLSSAQWNVTQETGNLGSELRFSYGNDQYAVLHLNSSYFRLNTGPASDWGTSVILMPSFWDNNDDYYQGVPVTATWETSATHVVVQITGTIPYTTSAVPKLDVSIVMTLSAPSASSMMVQVASAIISGSVPLSSSHENEAFKPLMLSSMRVSENQWDTQYAFADGITYTLPTEGWITSPISATVFGLQGGKSSWQENDGTPTIRIELEKPMWIGGWVSSTSNPNDDNIGFWAASSKVVMSWRYRIVATASTGSWANYLPLLSKSLPTSTWTPTATQAPTPTSTPTFWKYAREFNNPSVCTTGSCSEGAFVQRENACAGDTQVVGTFGGSTHAPYPAKAGYIEYQNVIDLPESNHLYLKARYSKNSSSQIPIDVLIDGVVRGSFLPQDMQNWDAFTCSVMVDLGEVSGGIHTVRFSTDTGQPYGIADLDIFVVTNSPNYWDSCGCNP